MSKHSASKLYVHLMCIAMSVLFLTACAGTGGAPVAISLPNPMAPSADCNIKLDALTAGKEGASLIRQRIPNPCDAYRVSATLAKGGVIWDLYKAEQLAKWGEDIKAKINLGLTYSDLKSLFDKEIVRFNKQMAGTYLMLSDLMLTFNETSLISAPDVAILNAGLDRLIADAKRLATLTG
jgi:hypothetical protein